ncbi:blue-light-activated protein [bacterium BMS3Bbin06]|nr:blue-light-activated protein [bacterium BMS3Abin08]GBE34500.1 blue-light-activated protein [bacterium BMS3Bbin06]
MLAAAIIGLGWRYYNDKLLVKKLSLEYDLSKEKERLKNYSSQLEELVAERTKELRKSEAMLKTLHEYANDGIVIMDDKGVIMDVNKKAADIHGYEKAELIGKNIEILELEKHHTIGYERMNRLLSGEPLVFETEHLRKDGSTIALEISAKAIKIDGDILIQSIHRDITEKKRLQAQLLHSQKMESIGTLAGGIAHDFNNILTTVLGYSDLILIDENLSPEVAKKVRVIETAARKASSLVSKLLSFARRGSIEPVPFDINQVVNETVEMLSRIISNDITIKRSFNVRIPPVMGDVNQVEQILMNLIINAKDAISGNGEITISTSTVELSSEGFSLPADIRKGQYVKLSVSDTGKGIPEEHRERIFEPFFTTQGVGKGTGLGLAMVYGIVKEHGGYITVDSEIGVGTTFDIYLPVAEARTPGSRSDLIDNGKSVGEILVVDDEFTVLDLIKETLLRNGFSVKAFDNPLQGLNYFRTNSKKVSLVIADIVMPEMDGIQLIESIRELNPNIKIIATTGFSQNLGDIEVEGFLKKPFQSSKLMSIVREVLNGEDDAVNLK